MDEGIIVENWNPKKSKFPNDKKAMELVDDSRYVNQILNKIK